MDDDQITLEFGRVISVTASGSTRATTIQLAAVGSEGDDDGAERGDAVEVLQPAGLMAAPAVTATTEAPFIRLGDRQVALGLIDKGASAQDVEGGETRVYGSGASNATATLRIRASGVVEITSISNANVVITAPGTGVVTFQDGSQAFLRGNQFATAVTTFIAADNALLTALITVMTAIGAYATAVGIVFPPAAPAAVALNAAIVVFNAAVATRQAAGSAFDSATTASLSTRVRGQ